MGKSLEDNKNMRFDMKKILLSGYMPLIILGMLIVWTISCEGSTGGQEKEQLYFQEIPTVVTASRMEQPINEAPSTITIITEEEIKQSGAANIPDLLRNVPGLDIMTMTAADTNIGARGINEAISNKILTMIDGRSVYYDFYGDTAWTTLPILLNDIKRIEIIKGPGSALYGANAFSSVINIITKSPEETQNSVAVMGGENNTKSGTVMYAGRSDKLSYKMGAGYDEANKWSDPNKSDVLSYKFISSVKYSVSDVQKLTLDTALTKNKGDMSDATGDLYDYLDNNQYLRLFYEQPELTFQLFWNGSRGNIENSNLFNGDRHILTDTYDAEFEHTSKWDAMNSTIIFGGNYRINKISSDIIDDPHEQDIKSLFLQDSCRCRDDLIFTLGGRYDYHPLIGDRTSPRGSMVYMPFPGHTLRVSAGSAFRSPTFVESYAYINNSSFFPGITFTGNKDLRPEKINSYELGYQMPLFERVKGKIDLFYNELSDLIAETTTMGVPIQSTYVNSGDAIALGGEMGVDIDIAKGLSGLLNYSYQNSYDLPNNNQITTVAHHKANAELRAKFDNGLSQNVIVNYVGETSWTDEDLPPYTLINTRTGYTFPGGNMEVYLSVFNLFRDLHYEDPIGEEIGRKIMAGMNYAF